MRNRCSLCLGIATLSLAVVSSQASPPRKLGPMMSEDLVRRSDLVALVTPTDDESAVRVAEVYGGDTSLKGKTIRLAKRTHKIEDITLTLGKTSKAFALLERPKAGSNEYCTVHSITFDRADIECRAVNLANYYHGSKGEDRFRVGYQIFFPLSLHPKSKGIVSERELADEFRREWFATHKVRAKTHRGKQDPLN